jgi:hypothetical protein
MSQPGFGRGFVGGRHNVDSLNESSQTRRLLEVRFGSLAASQQFITRAAGNGQKETFGLANPIFDTYTHQKCQH